MPSFIVKAKPEVDWYAFWSTIVDAPTRWGSRADLIQECYDPRDVAAERFERADANGTSAKIPGTPDEEQWFGWNDEEFILDESNVGLDLGDADGTWMLPRPNLRAFCDCLASAMDPSHLLRFEPYEDAAAPTPPAHPDDAAKVAGSEEA